MNINTKMAIINGASIGIILGVIGVSDVTTWQFWFGIISLNILAVLNLYQSPDDKSIDNETN